MLRKGLKITIFLPHIGAGGLTHIMLILAGGLAKTGYVVDLVVLNQQINPAIQNKLPSNINIIKLSAGRTFTAIFPLAKYLKESNIDVLISGGPSSNCIALLAKMIAKVKTKFIVTEHSLPSVDVYDSRKKLDKVIPLLMRVLYPKAEHIVSVSNAVADDLSKFANLPRQTIKTIYNPVVTSQLIAKSNELINHPWLENATNFNVIFVGRLEGVKNLELLISSYNYLSDYEKIKLIIIGEGSERGKLEKMCKDLKLDKQVSFLGYSSNPYAYMKKSDLLVLCSKWEGLPTVLIEAMACGTPVLVTNNIAGAKEIFNDSEHGFFIENSSMAIAEGIKKMMNAIFDEKLLIEKANYFSLESSLAEYEKLFKGQEEQL